MHQINDVIIYLNHRVCVATPQKIQNENRIPYLKLFMNATRKAVVAEATL
jgi:hypothetical protein